jgi:hypothetical protein
VGACASRGGQLPSRDCATRWGGSRGVRMPVADMADRRSPPVASSAPRSAQGGTRDSGARKRANRARRKRSAGTGRPQSLRSPAKLQRHSPATTLTPCASSRFVYNGRAAAAGVSHPLANTGRGAPRGGNQSVGGAGAMRATMHSRRSDLTPPTTTKRLAQSQTPHW